MNVPARMVSPHRENSPSTVEANGSGVTLAEIAALLAVAQDHAARPTPGVPAAGHGPRPAARPRGRAPGLERATTWWTSALRFLGCTGHAFDMAVVFGDEIEMRASAARVDFANPFDVMRVMVSHAGAGPVGAGPARSVLSVLAGGKKAAEMNFRTACEVADVFAKRLGLDEPVLAALASSFERWNGRGLPTGAKGTAIPRPMRVAQLSQELEVLARIEGITRALRSSGHGRARPTTRLSRSVRGGGGVVGSGRAGGPLGRGARGRATSPAPRRRMAESLLVLADFADLKSPWTGGHSRAVAALPRRRVAPPPRWPPWSTTSVESPFPTRSGTSPGSLPATNGTGLKPSACDRPTPAADPYTAALAGRRRRPTNVDGSGYHRRINGAQLDEAQRVIAAADCYQAMTSDRPIEARALRWARLPPNCGP